MCVSVSLKMFLASCGTAALLSPAGWAAAQTFNAWQPVMQASAQASAKPNLAGTWKLNKDQSDDPREKMRQAMGGSGGPGGGSGMGGGARPGGGGRERGQGGGMMDEFSQLTIDETDASTKVMGASGRVLALSAESDQGGAKESSAQGDADTPPAGKWQGSQFVVVTQRMGRGTTTRTYELSPDGKQLFMTTKMESERFSQPVTYRLVYDAGKSSRTGGK
jgi:hypothetical protein